jgi:WD40 repeat protein
MKQRIQLLVLLLLSTSLFAQNGPSLVLVGHQDGVNICKFSNDGKVLLSGSKDGVVRFWNVLENYKFIKEMKIADAPITAISFNHAGTLFAVGSLQKLFIYDVATGKLVAKKKNAHLSFVKSANFSPDDKWIVTSSWKEDALKVWSAPDLKKSNVFAEKTWTDEACFSPDGKFIVSCNHDNVCKTWDVATGNINRIFAGHEDWVYAVRISSDMKFMLSGSFDNTLRKWDFTTGKLLATYEGHKNGISYMTLSPDNSTAVSGSVDGSILLWRLEANDTYTVLRDTGATVLNLAFSPDGSVIAAALADHSILILNAAAADQR